MREIKRERLIEDTDVLLFDILENMKEIAEIVRDLKVTHISDGNLSITKNAPPKLLDCKYCGKTHEFPWQIGLCAKKNKKKEGAK